MGKFSLKGLKGGLKGVGGKVKVLGGKATTKGKDWLKEKWGAGSLQTGPSTESEGNGEEKEGKKKGGFSDLFKKKCPKCKSTNLDKSDTQDYTGYYCADCGHAWREDKKKKEEKTGKVEGPTTEQKEEAMERIREEHAGSKKIGFDTQNIGKKIGGIIGSLILFGISAGGGFYFFPKFGQMIMILSGIAVAFLIISMFVKGKHTGPILFGGFILLVFVSLWQFGYSDKLIAYADPYVEKGTEYLDKGWIILKDTGLKTQCILSDPANADACMKAIKINTTESVNKLGPYETVELKWGRRLDGSYDTDPVESGQDYTLDVSFFNKNTAVYEVNFTQVNAYTTITDTSNVPQERSTEPKSAFTGGKYTLDPKEELPIRFKEFKLTEVNPNWNCLGSQTFKVNATTEQKSGGWSDFGMAPSDEGDFRKFIHGFKPNINAEPGPLNIYVYTDPWGIPAEDFIGVIGDDRAEVIIKIQNKVKTGTAKIDKLYLVQEFEVPDQLFEIKYSEPDLCEGTRDLKGGNITVGPDTSGLCSSSWKNCLEFTFLNTLVLKPNEKVTITCKIDNIKIPTNEYTDQIRVYANFNYTQQWTNPIPCLTYV